MLHLHLIGLLTLEILTLIAALLLLIYVNKQQLSKWYRYASAAIVVILAVIILCTIAHPVIHHFHAGHSEDFHHNKCHEKHYEEEGHH